MQLVEKYWPVYREKILYLAVGAWNMAFTYGLFALLYYLLHEWLFSSLILVIVYVISSLVGFVGYRYIVFRSSGDPVREYLRFQLVYAPLAAVNMFVLPVAIAYTDWNAYAIQAAFSVIAVILSYLGNKYFAFRRGA